MVRYSTAPALRGRRRWMPTAPSVPTTAAQPLAHSPSTTLLRSASSMARSAKRVRYQSSDSPPHTLETRLWLNEYTTTSTSGR